MASQNTEQKNNLTVQMEYYQYRVCASCHPEDDFFAVVSDTISQIKQKYPYEIAVYNTFRAEDKNRLEKRLQELGLKEADVSLPALIMISEDSEALVCLSGLDEIKEKLEDMVKHSGTIIFTPNLNHLKKGGRITPAVAMLGNMLKLVPVMELNSELGGKIDTLGKVRTTRKACKMLADRVVERGANAKDYTFAIEDVLVPEEAQRVRDYLEEQLGPCQVTMRELPSVVGAHMGIGGVGIQFIKNLAE